MSSSADAQAEAIADVERIARDIYATSQRFKGWLRAWDDEPPWQQELYRATVRDMLQRDVIKVGHRPTVERPMEGQLTVDEALSG